MGPFLWAWHPISTAALVQCPPIAGNDSIATWHTYYSIYPLDLLIAR